MTPILLVALLSANVETLLEQWDVEGAERALRERAKDGRTAYLEGLVLLHRGRYQEAAGKMSESAAEDPGARLHRELASAAAEITRDFVSERSEGGHFLLRSSARDRLLLTYAGEALEAARTALATDLGLAPSETIAVDVYERPEDLARVSTLTAEEIRTSGTIALCKWNRLMIVTPRALLRGYPWIDTLVHEYVHYVISRLTRNRVPIWLHEGIARRFEARHRMAPGEREPLSPAQAHLLFAALRRDELIPLARMHPSMAKLPSQRDTALAFAQVQTIVEHLEDLGGPGAIRDILEGIRDGQDAMAAVQGVTRKSMEAFLRGWRRSLRARSKRSGPEPLELVFLEPGNEGRDGDDSSGEREGRYERLGGLLRARGRVRAAAIEYEKALASGKPGPFLLAKTARAHFESGDSKKALERARASLSVYPDLAGSNVTAGEAALALGDADGARRHLLAALRVSPFDPRVHCGLAEIYERVGDPRAERERRACRDLSR